MILLDPAQIIPIIVGALPMGLVCGLLIRFIVRFASTRERFKGHD